MPISLSKVPKPSFPKIKGSKPPVLAESSSREELAEISSEWKEFKKDARDRASQMEDVGDVDFLLCLTFDSAEQKNEFIKAANLSKHVLYNQYADGSKFAKTIGIELATGVKKPLKVRRSSTWDSLASPIPKESET